MEVQAVELLQSSYALVATGIRLSRCERNLDYDFLQEYWKLSNTSKRKHYLGEIFFILSLDHP